jgi:hypothetical protein
MSRRIRIAAQVGRVRGPRLSASVRMVVCGAMAILVWSGPSEAIEPSVIAKAWERDRTLIETQSQLPWTLKEGDAESLSAGEPLVRPLQQSADLLTVGMIWLDYPREEVWLAIHDRDDRPLSQGGLVYHTLRAQPDSWRTSHAILNLPWPLKDRQWVSLVRINWTLMEATERRVLERWVELGAPALAESPDPAALWLEELHGGWLLLEVEGGTLALFSARTPSAGPLPPDIVQPWVTKTVSGSLEQLRSNLGDLQQHYQGTHLPLPGPDGNHVPLYP